jgi:L-ascorbate metabolism protein UlaG (beta-lactamase superfamily)
MYLKSNIVIEPLVMKWYAWSHLISPSTLSRNIVGRHLRIMDSYIKAAEFHREAVKDPKMLGGPFIDYKDDKTQEIENLVKETQIRQRKLIELNQAFTDLNDLLKTNAKGQKLESLYQLIPGPLKGFVELVYDINNNPGFKIYERLLYQEYYDESTQSIALWETNNDSRPFVLSTPRINNNNVLFLDIPFSSSIIDKIAYSKRNSIDIEPIIAELGLTGQRKELFESLFSNENPNQYQNYSGDRIRMRYFGHACILIETSDISILVDPLISYFGYMSEVDHFSDYDLPEVIDYVLITHNHQDHILLETLLPLRHKIKNIIVPKSNRNSYLDPNLKLMFNHIGFNNVYELDELEEINKNDCKIIGLPFMGEHSDLDIASKLCHFVQIGNFKLLFVADSRIIDSRVYEHLQKTVGNVDIIFLGMECDGAPSSWLYGPLMFKKLEREYDQQRRLSGSDCDKGMSLINIFNPKEVYVYAMGMEPWCEFISSIKYTDMSNPIIESNRLIEICSQKGIIAERLYGEKEILYSK